jgi:hypothetical protein
MSLIHTNPVTYVKVEPSQPPSLLVFLNFFYCGSYITVTKNVIKAGIYSLNSKIIIYPEKSFIKIII